MHVRALIPVPVQRLQLKLLTFLHGFIINKPNVQFLVDEFGCAVKSEVGHGSVANNPWNKM